MKLTIAILVLVVGTVWAQNPSIIDNTKAKLNGVQQQNTAQSNAALAATQGKPTPAIQAAPAGNASTVSVKPFSTAQPSSNAKAASVTSATPAPKPSAPQAATKVASKKKAKPASAEKPASHEKTVVAVEDKKTPVDAKKNEPKTLNLTGRRDPFISPVVNRGALGSGCNTGKRCLAIDQITLSGIVKSDTGMIAVVVNALNKAYFLRENDPVFNGYVVKITGDSIMFKETVQDKLGKPFTRDVTKKIMTPAV